MTITYQFTDLGSDVSGKDALRQQVHHLVILCNQTNTPNLLTGVSNQVFPNPKTW